MTHDDFVAARREIDDLIGLASFCETEEMTVEKKKMVQTLRTVFSRKEGIEP